MPAALCAALCDRGLADRQAVTSAQQPGTAAVYGVVVSSVVSLWHVAHNALIAHSALHPLGCGAGFTCPALGHTVPKCLQSGYVRPTHSVQGLLVKLNAMLYLLTKCPNAI